MKKRIIIIVLSIVFIKCIAILFLENFNTFEDYVIAQNILSNGSFFIISDGAMNHSYQFPIYPILISCAFFIKNNIHSAILINILCSAFACLLLFRNIERLRTLGYIFFTEKWSYILSVLPLLHPAFLHYELQCVHPFCFDFLLLNLGITMLISSLLLNNNRWFDMGIWLGIVVLGRGTFIIFPVLIISTLLLKKQFKSVTTINIGMLLIVGAWLTHNYATDQVFGLTSTSGKLLWKGSLHNSDGGNYLLNGENYNSALSIEEQNTIGRATVVEQNKFFMDKYLNQWKTEPNHVVKMFFIKLKNFWFISSNAGIEYSSSIKKAIPFYQIINALSIGLLLFLSFKTKQFYWFYLVLALSSLQCFFYFETRHRLLFDPLLLVICSNLWMKYRKTEKQP